jgi:cobalt-zinc-cadmium efflux system protein
MNQKNDHTQIYDGNNYNKAFSFGIILNVVYIFVEVLYGLIVNSMALIADAGHNFGDVLGLSLAWGASYLAQKASTKRKTYGMKKSTILAALLNAIIFLIAVGAITIEAIKKVFNPEPVSGKMIIIVAGIGVLINTITAILFVKGRKTDINIKGAFLHMAADAGVSLGVVTAGLIILFTGWYLIDPIMGLIIAFIITVGTWGLLRDSFYLSIDAVPKNIDFEKVKKFLQSLDGVKNVHDLHIWPMSTTETALTAHLVVAEKINEDSLIKCISDRIRKNFYIGHVTIQMERQYEDHCEQRPDMTV